MVRVSMLALVAYSTKFKTIVSETITMHACIYSRACYAWAFTVFVACELFASCFIARCLNCYIVESILLLVSYM